MNILRKTSNYISLLAITLFFIGAIYYRGLFFDTDIYWIESIFGVIFSFFLFTQFKDSLKIYKNPYVWSLVLIVFIYLFDILFAENQLFAFQHFLRWLLATQMFLIVLYLKEIKWMQKIIFFSVMVAGIWTSLFGWLSLYKLVNFKDAVWDNRLSSFFQYANTFGAFIVAVLIGVLVLSSSKKWRYSFWSFASFILFISMIFTYSRGSWLVFAFIWFVTLLFLSLQEQVLFVFHSILLGTATLINLSSLNNSINNGSYIKGFTIIIVYSLLIGILYSIFVFFINKIKFNISKKKIIHFLIPLLIVVVFISGLSLLSNDSFVNKLPNSLKERVQQINLTNKSVMERNLFYKDSMKMIKDSPFIGQGGGAWKQKIEKYQSYPYISREAHNFYLNLLIEIGILGFLVFISLILLILWSLIKKRRELSDEISLYKAIFLMIVVLFMHSFIDFDMSFAYILVLLMMLLALIAQPIEVNFSKKNTFSIISLILVMVMSFVSILTSTKFMYANKLLSQINTVQNSEITKKFDRIISLNPYDVNYRLDYMNYYYQMYLKTKNDNYKKLIYNEATKVNNMNEKDPRTMLILSQMYADVGDLSYSEKLIQTGIDNGPWVLNLSDQYTTYALSFANYYNHTNDKEKYNKYLNKIFEIYNQVLKRRDFLDNQVKEFQYENYKPSIIMELNVGKAYILKGQYKDGLKMLNSLTDENVLKSRTVDNRKNYTDQRIKYLSNTAIAWMIYTYDKLNNQQKVNEFMKKGDMKDIQSILDTIKTNWENK